MPVRLPKDMLNKSLKEIVYVRSTRPLFRKLAKETHFNLKETEALGLIHFKICNERGPLTRILFRDILHSGFDCTDSYQHLLIDCVYTIINKEKTLQLEVGQWIRGLSVLLRGTLDEQINFVYKVYNLMMGKIEEEQILRSMRGCLINVGPDKDLDETVKDMIELLFKTLDIDCDGIISESDFKKAIKEKNTLLLECMGPVFPSREFCDAVFTTLTSNFKDF